MKTQKTLLDVPFIVKKDSDGYIVECVDLNIVTQGDSAAQARKNIIEAINLHFESAEELGILELELEKLGVFKKNNKLQVAPRELESAPIELPIPS